MLIDIGGTLIEEKASRAELYAEAAAARGLRVEPAEMARHMRAAHDSLPLRVAGAYRYTDRWFEAFMEHVFHRRLGLERALLPGIAAELFARFQDPATFRLFPGALGLLDETSRLGLAVAAVSNWGQRLPVLLEGLGLAQRLDAVLCSALEACEKPDPALFARALERLGAAPSEALHAGDHPENDVAGARAAGIEAVLVDHAGRHGDLDLPRVRDLAELGRLVRERAA